jgi:hypothetical protein
VRGGLDGCLFEESSCLKRSWGEGSRKEYGWELGVVLGYLGLEYILWKLHFMEGVDIRGGVHVGVHFKEGIS